MTRDNAASLVMWILLGLFAALFVVGLLFGDPFELLRGAKP